MAVAESSWQCCGLTISKLKNQNILMHILFDQRKLNNGCNLTAVPLQSLLFRGHCYSPLTILSYYRALVLQNILEITSMLLLDDLINPFMMWFYLFFYFYLLLQRCAKKLHYCGVSSIRAYLCICIYVFVYFCLLVRLFHLESRWSQGEKNWCIEWPSKFQRSFVHLECLKKWMKILSTFHSISFSFCFLSAARKNEFFKKYRHQRFN